MQPVSALVKLFSYFRCLDVSTVHTLTPLYNLLTQILHAPFSFLPSHLLLLLSFSTLTLPNSTTRSNKIPSIPPARSLNFSSSASNHHFLLLSELSTLLFPSLNSLDIDSSRNSIPNARLNQVRLQKHQKSPKSPRAQPLSSA